MADGGADRTTADDEDVDVTVSAEGHGASFVSEWNLGGAAGRRQPFTRSPFGS